MSFDLDNLERKRIELQKKVDQFESQRENVKSLIEKLTARYNIGEINFEQYKNEYRRLFNDKTPEQWVTYYNIQIKSCKAQLDWYDSEIKKVKKGLGKKTLEFRERENRKKAIEERIQTAEGYKKSVMGSVGELVRKYNAREITYVQYQSEVKKLYNGNEPQKIVDYYDDYIKKAKDSLNVYGKPKIKGNLLKILPLVLIFGLVLFGLFGFVLKPGFTGLTVKLVSEIHTKTYNLVLNESATYDFDLPQEGNLNWIKLNGKVGEEGSVKIYLDDLLIFDSGDLKNESKSVVTGSAITGFATEEGSSELSAEAPSEEGSGEEQNGDSLENTPAATEQTESDLTGSSEEPPVSEVSGGEDTSGEQEVSNETTVEEEPNNETAESNETTQDSQNETDTGSTQEDQSGEIIFRNYCKESCDLKDLDLNKSSYSLRIEVDGAEIELDDLTYEISVEKEVNETENISVSGPPVLIKEIPTIMIEKNGYSDLDINEFFGGAKDYYLKQTDDISTTVSGAKIRIIPAENFTGLRESRIVVVNEFGSYGSNLFNISVLDNENFTTIEQFNVTGNATLNITTKQYKAIINRPVKWVKKIDLENVTDLENISLEIPKSSENISIKTGEEAESAMQEAVDYADVVGETDREEIASGITGNVASNINGRKGIITRLFEWFRSFGVTGRVIDGEDLGDEITEGQDSKLIDVEKIVDQTNELQIAVEYYTPAPLAFEEAADNGKIVTVSAQDELNYTDILAYTLLDNQLPINSSDLIVYWHASYEDALAYGYIKAITNSSGEEIVDTPEIENETVEQESSGQNVDTEGSVSENESNLSESVGLGEEMVNGSSFLTGFAVSDSEDENVLGNNPANLTANETQNSYLIPMNYSAYDLDEDGNIDYVEWIVPHLSNQTFNIVINRTTSAYSSNITLDNGYVHLVPLNSAPYNNLMLYLSFDADTINTRAVTHYDFSRYENDGIGLSNATVNSTNCLFGQCANFDGVNSSINVVGSGNLAFYRDKYYTWSFWINPNSFYTGIMGKFSGSCDFLTDSGYSISLGDDPYLVFYDCGSGTSIHTDFLDFNKWYHVAIVYNNTNTTIYLNGVQNASAIISFAKNDTSNPLLIGQGWGEYGPASPFKGILDEIMVFNVSLNVTQIIDIYNNQSVRYPAAEKVDVLEFNLTYGQNKVNVSFPDYHRSQGSNITVSVGYWDISKGFNNSDFSGNNLVSYYHFDESGWVSTKPITDSGSKGNNLDPMPSFGGAAQSLQNYPYYKSALFDGSNDYLSDGDVKSFNGEDNVTFVAWVKRTGTGSVYETIVSQGDTANGYGLMASCNDSLIRIISNPWKSTSVSVTYNRSVLLDSQWHHLVGVIAVGKNMSLYIDGFLVNTTTIGTPDVSTSYAKGVRIGGTNDSSVCGVGTSYFKGNIDEVMLFNRSLTEDEVRGLYVKGRALWVYASPQALLNLSSYDNSSRNEFLIDVNTTNVHARLNLSSGNYRFYTPLIRATSTAPATLISHDLKGPDVGFISPTPSSGVKIRNLTFPVNLSSTDIFDYYSFIELNRDLALWWKMDDSEVDSSSWGNDGLIDGDTVQVDDGRFGKAFSFDGDADSITCRRTDGFPNGNAGKSISAWVYPNESGDVDVFDTIFSSGYFSSDEMFALVWTNHNSFAADQGGDSFAGSDLLLNRWYHVVLSYNNSNGNYTLFVNGVFNGSKYMNTRSSTSMSCSVGIRVDGDKSTSFKGKIDEVMLFNRTLTYSEVRALYNASLINPLSVNLRAVQQGDVNITGWSNDVNANLNLTSRTFFWDYSNPLVSFLEVTPDNGTYVNESYIEVAINASDNTQVYSTTDFNKDILLLLRMDDINSTGHPIDLSIYGNNATKFGNAAQNDSGYYGSGFNFDGNNDYLVTGSNGLQVPKNVTIGAWFNTNNTGETDQFIMINYNFGIEFNRGVTSGQRISFISRFNSAGWTVRNYDAPGVLSGWHHVAQTFDGNNFTGYLDGVAVGSWSYSGDSIYTAGNGYNIGSWYGAGSEYFNGTIDDVIVFNRSMNGREISSLYNASAFSYDRNFTDLADARSYQIDAFAADMGGNYNRTSITVLVDRGVPSIRFDNPSPANGAFLGGGNIYVNFSSNDTFSPTYAFMDVANSLFLWYDMDTVNATGEPTDLAGRLYNGTKVGNARRIPSGRFGEGFRADGTSNYIRAPAISVNLTKNGFTQSMWFNFVGLPSVGQTNYLSYFYAGTTDSHYFRAANTAGVYSLQAYGEMNDDSYLLSKGSMTSSDLLGWHNLVSVYNLTDVIFYVDGVKIGNDQTSRVQVSTTFTNNFFVYDLVGAGDEILMFNRSLTDAEVYALYNATANRTEVNLTNYNFGSGSKTITLRNVDRAGNKNVTQISFFLDSDSPVLNFTSQTPANASYISANSVAVNVSSSDTTSDHYALTDFNRDLLLWLRMDDVNSSGNPIDSSSYGNNLSIYGATQTAAGYWGKAFDFFQGYIKANSSSLNFDASENYSVALWFKSDSTGSQGLVSKGESYDSNKGFSIIADVDSTGISVAPNVMDVSCVDGSTAVYSGQWYFVVVTFSNKNVTIYLNSAMDGNAICSNLNDNFVDSVNLGFAHHPVTYSADYLDGKMDEVVIFNRTLTQAEVSSLYNASINKYYRNFTGLVNGMNYNFRSYAVDRANNVAQTEMRTITPDTNNPTISYAGSTPVNRSYITYTPVINVSSSDTTSDHYVLTDFNRDLLLWLRMDDVNSTGDPTDLSKYSNNGTRSGNAVQTSAGYFGKGFNLDGSSDYITLPNNNLSKPTANFSWGAWFYALPRGVSGGSYNGIISARESTGSTLGYNVYIEDLVSNYTGCNVANGTSSFTASSNSPVSLYQWHHIICVYNGTHVVQYLDGVLQSDLQAVNFRNVIYGSSPTSIGKFYSNLNLLWFNGTIDEVVLFNRSLTSQEVGALYNASANRYVQNYSTITDGPYNFKSYAVDRAGNLVNTDERNFVLDRLNPSLSFDLPTPNNNALIPGDSALINVSTSETNNAYTLVDFNRDLLLWLRMDDVNSTGGFIDSSSYSNNGTPVGDVAQTSSGYFGKGLELNGSADYLDLGNSSAFALTKNFSISIWFYPKGKAFGSGNEYIFAKQAGAISYCLKVGSTDYNLYFLSLSSNAMDTGFDMTLNQWHHMVLVVNSTGTGVTPYLNGVKGNEISFTGFSPSEAPKLYLGDYQGSGASITFNGTIDDFAIFNRSLTQQEVRALYNSSLYRFERNFTNLVRGVRYNYTASSVDRAGNVVNLTRGLETNKAPRVTYVPSIPAQTPIENNYKTVTFDFQVYDENGYGDISEAYVNFTRNGVVRNSMVDQFQDQCSYGSIDQYTANVTCSIDMWYFDEPGYWNVTIMAVDANGQTGINQTASFYYNLLTAMTISPNVINFGAANSTQTYFLGPFTSMNNTGNANVTNISIQGRDLYGFTNSSIIFGVGNFTVGTSSALGLPPPACNVGGGSATRLVNTSYVNITGATLPRGNHSINDGSTGQETVYYCIPAVPNLPSQMYTTDFSSGASNPPTGPWIIKIALAVFARKLAKKKTRKEVLSELKRKLHKPGMDIESLALLDEKLKEEQGLTLSDLLSDVRMEAESLQIPIDVFRQEIGPSEALCKYLKENVGYSYSEIADVLNRDDRTVWINYRNASIKKVARTRVRADTVYIPISVFKDRRLSVLEAVVTYFKDRGVTNIEIARLLGKDPRNIWTLYSRAVRKLKQ